MKITILFLLASFNMLAQEIPPVATVFSQSDLKNQNGIACVLYNKKFYSMKWFGIDSVNKAKKWVITEVIACTFGGPNSAFQNVIDEPVEATAEIQMQLLNIRNLRHPK